MTTSEQSIRYHVDANGIAHLMLSRPDVANAFDDHTIVELIDALDTLATYANVKGLTLTGEGRHFSAGADLHWMRSMVDRSKENNERDAYQMATLLEKLDTFPHPTLALVNGSAFGGALGLICCCDMVVAHQHSKFCLSEVKLGLVPATIAPYVIRAMGVRQARRYMLTAEIIDAHRALELDLIHIIEDEETATNFVDSWIANISNLAPQALAITKKLCARCEQVTVDGQLKRYTSELIAQVRVSKEGQEGVSAFLAKRSPNWKEPS